VVKLDKKDALYEALASVAKALGSGRRTEIVDVLSQGEHHVDELAREMGQSVANTSHHLQQLLRAGLVRTRREGTRVYYSLASEGVAELWRTMRDVARQHVAELDTLVDAYLGDRDELAAITRDDLVERLAAGDVVVLDIRPPAEFDAGHVPGAINVPPDEIDERIAKLPGGRSIVAYCRGPLCLLSHDAVRRLRAAGVEAQRLEDGFPEWAAAGLPVERTRA
jgi:rhodanese-related sulfurtransferase/DNA-binding HxlR family transcriptional regulator